MKTPASRSPDRHAELDEAPREPRHHSRAKPTASHHRDDERDEQRAIDGHDADEGKRLDDDREGMTDQHGARNPLVRHELQKPVRGRRCCERTDTEGVEEVRGKSDEDVKPSGRSRTLRRLGREQSGPIECGSPSHHVESRKCAEREQQRTDDVQGASPSNRLRHCARRSHINRSYRQIAPPRAPDLEVLTT